MQGSDIPGEFPDQAQRAHDGSPLRFCAIMLLPLPAET